MANVEAQIKPNGISQRNLVDLLYMIVYSIQGICTKLDLDNNADNTYVAASYTAIFNGEIRDSRGNYIMNRPSAALDDRFFEISPTGISDAAMLEYLFQIFTMMHTLTTQCDADDLTTSTYHHIYDDRYAWIVENCKGEQIGNGTSYYFRPGGVFNYDQLVDVLYDIVYSLSLLTAKLDTDAKPAGSDYAALWYTATILMRIENQQGSVIGNTPTVMP